MRALIYFYSIGRTINAAAKGTTLMTTERKTFSQAVLDEYMAIHDRLVGMKYSYLTLVQLDSVSPSDKQALKDDVCSLADGIRTHFTGLMSKEINDYNIVDFERREHEFIRDIRKLVDAITKKANRLSPVKIESHKVSQREHEIDAKLLDSRVYDAPALERNRLEGLGRFQRYLLDHVYVEDTTSSTTPKADAVQKELLQMKVDVYQDRFRDGDADNLDILYKMKTKFESLYANAARVTVVGPTSVGQDCEVVPEQITIVYDDLYNVRLIYQKNTTTIDLTILLASAITSDGISYSGRVSGTTTAAGNCVQAHLTDAHATTDILDLETYRDRYQGFLQQAELRTVYSASLSHINLKHREDEQSELRVQSEMRDRVSSALDDLL